MYDLRHYLGVFLRAMAGYTVVTILVGVAAALVMAFLARPLIGLMLIAAFTCGLFFRQLSAPYLGAHIAAWASPVASSNAFASRERHTGHGAV